MLKMACIASRGSEKVVALLVSDRLHGPRIKFDGQWVVEQIGMREAHGKTVIVARASNMVDQLAHQQSGIGPGDSPFTGRAIRPGASQLPVNYQVVIEFSQAGR